MTEYLKMVPLTSWWQKFDLKDLSISELFEELLSWNSESKLITPKYITATYFGAIVAIFNFCFSICFLCVMFFLTPQRAPKAGPWHLFIYSITYVLSIHYECLWCSLRHILSYHITSKIKLLQSYKRGLSLYSYFKLV